MTLVLRRPLRWLAALVLVLGGLWLLAASGLVGLGLHYLATRQADPAWRQSGLWLPFYSADIDARPVPGLTENLSGLTYSSATDTLFAVQNRPPTVVELSTEGVLLRRIPVSGGLDLEGITHVEGSRFILVDERQDRLDWVEITAATTSLDLLGAPSLVLAFDPIENMGFEGLSWDGPRGDLLIAQEMAPVQVIVVGGLQTAMNGGPLALSVRGWDPLGFAGHAVADLSSLTAHDATGNLLLLSHMSSMLLEYSRDGAPVSMLPLWGGAQRVGTGHPASRGGGDRLGWRDLYRLRAEPVLSAAPQPAGAMDGAGRALITSDSRARR